MISVRESDSIPGAYEELLKRYFDVAAYQLLVENSRSRNAKLSKAGITPFPGIDFGSSPDQLIRVLGAPSLMASPPNTLSEQISLYRSVFMGLKVRLEFHFQQRKLFYSRWVFRHASKEDSNRACSAIVGEHLPNVDFDETTDKIIDARGNELMISRGVGLCIDHLHSRGPTFDQIRSERAVDHTNHDGLGSAEYDPRKRAGFLRGDPATLGDNARTDTRG